MHITRRSFFKASAGISVVAVSNRLLGPLPETPPFDMATFVRSLEEASTSIQNVIDAFTKVVQCMVK